MTVPTVGFCRTIMIEPDDTSVDNPAPFVARTVACTRWWLCKRKPRAQSVS